MFGTDINGGLLPIPINTLSLVRRILRSDVTSPWRSRMKVQRLGLTLSMVFAVSTALVAAGSPAFAAHNDNNETTLWDDNAQCQAGLIEFIDYGEGAPGGGMNDDYFVVTDTCANGEGVRARVYVNGVLVGGSKYNGGGSGSSVIWDPAQIYANDVVKMEICAANGPQDYSGLPCDDRTFRSVDG
ncbi:hypothetical protein ACWCO3_19615 [Micromonospora sp. NPDC002411]